VARKPSPTLTDGEVKLMRVLWRQGPSTVAAIVDAVAGDNPPAYNTVQTMMRILERKGFVSHRKDGRAFVFHALVDEAHARKHAIRHVLDRFFDNSPGSLVLSLLEHEDVPASELRQLRELIQRHEWR
jgi:BlaI family transcriptional regulator, penicillinase repressor